MLQRFFLLLVSFFLFLVSENIGNAAVIYTPGPAILMTGSTSEARFDVAEVLYDSGMEWKTPKLETASKTFTGVFYLNSIGWVDFNTGSYIVGFDCGSQYLSGLTSNCHLTGTGWSEVAGEVDFSAVEYVPALGELSGSVSTYAGDIPLAGIHLALYPAELNEDLSQLFVSTSLSLSVSGVELYGAGNWDLEYTPLSATEPQYIDGCSCGVFSDGDFSYADDYRITITDPSGSNTEFVVTIHPGEASTSLDPSSSSNSNFIYQFCSSHPSECPDGASLAASTKEQDGTTGKIADGKSFYHITLKPRDTYGNRVNTGTVMITYAATVSSIQIPSGTISPYDTYSNLHDALIFSGETFTPDYGGTWESDTINLSGQDIRYDIASVAPTDGSDNTIFLSEVLYTTADGDTSTTNDPTLLEFLPAFESIPSAPPSIKIGEENAFNTTITKNTTESFVPNIFTLLMVGNGNNAAFRDFTSSEYIDCQAYFQDFPTYTGNCNWSMMNTYIFPSVFETTTDTDFAFSGIYAPFTAFPTEEPVSYATYVHYTKANLGSPSGYFGGDDILYLSHRGTFGTSEYRAPKVKILGQNNGLGEYGTIGMNKVTRAKFIDAIRKNVALLSRNRSDYSGVPYTIYSGDLPIDNATFNTKRTIVVVGGDVTISADIAARSAPLAIIALTDSSGNGGNILIDSSVKDVNASLVAEHSVHSSGDLQLYIHGSVISANTLGDTLAHICPYYITSVCDETEAAKYDLENLRTFDGTDGSKASSSLSAQSYSSTPVIIEYDMSIQQDPPPVLY